jgi:potassium-transporting ATPase KdpC subunit
MGVAQAWGTGDPSHSQYVDSWAQTHANVVAEWVKANPSTPEPKAADLAVVFFEHFSNEYPGKFPSAVTQTGADGTPQTTIEPVSEGTDIQAFLFDMWRQEHADADLQDVPGDLVTASGSGLDPHITLENTTFQLERVAAAWAEDTKRDPATVRTDIARLLQEHAAAPFGGLAGEKLINVLDINLALRNRYGALQRDQKNHQRP